MAPSSFVPTCEYFFTLKQLHYLHSLFTDFMLLYGTVTNELMTSEAGAVCTPKEDILPIGHECEMCC